MRQNVFTYPQTANFYKRSVTDGYFKGYFVNQAALEAAYPVGQNGWFAIVGSTDTVWVWDSGTNDWVDTGNSTLGDVIGPASSTDNALVRFDLETGKLIQNSLAILSDEGALSGLSSLLSDYAIIGDPGTEDGGINIAGVTYQSTFKVSDIDGTNYAQTILHRHSTTLEPLIVGARSNSDDGTHADITAGQNVLSIYGAGWAGSNYKLFGSIDIGADSAGTISDTSAPGRMRRFITPDGSITPVVFETVSNDGSIDRADKVTKKSTLQDYAEKQTDVAAAATTTLDIEDGNVFKLTQNTNITTLNFNNPSPSGNACSFTIIRVKDNSGTARTIAWPAAVKWANGGVAPVLSSSANAVDIFSFVTIDAGTTWYGFVGGVNFA